MLLSGPCQRMHVHALTLLSLYIKLIWDRHSQSQLCLCSQDFDILLEQPFSALAGNSSSPTSSTFDTVTQRCSMESPQGPACTLQYPGLSCSSVLGAPFFCGLGQTWCLQISIQQHASLWVGTLLGGVRCRRSRSGNWDHEPVFMYLRRLKLPTVSAVAPGQSP